MICDLVGREDLAAGVALQSAAFNVARVIGPAFGSLIYTVFGAGWCFFINAISFVAIIFAIMMISTDLTQRGGAQGSVWLGLLEGLRYLKSNRSMKAVVSLTAVTSIFAFSVYSTLMPALADDMLGITEHDRRYGLLFSAIGVGSVTGAYLVGKFAAANKRGALLIGGANLFALSLLLLSRTTLLAPAIILFIVMGLAAISQLATANSLTQSLAPESLRGRAVSTHMFAVGGLQPAGALFAGWFAQRWGVANALAFGAITFWIYTVGLVLVRPATIRLE
jgi:predicted MFS family arabinose efflux permease